MEPERRRHQFQAPKGAARPGTTASGTAQHHSRIKLADDISKSVAHQHHRMLGFKSEEAGLSRAKAGVMRRLSMVALRATARQVLRGLAIVGPPCIHQHNAREAARRAHLDAFGADRGAPWRNPTNGGG